MAKTETKEVRKRGYEGTRRYAYDVQNTYKGLSEDEWKAMIIEEYEIIANKPTCEWLLFVFHDNDIDKEGLPKPLHVHFLVKFKAGRTTSAVMSDFCGTNPRTENCLWVDARKGGYKSLARYMTHHSESAYNEKKTWYHHSAVYAYGIDYLELIKSTTANKANVRDMKDSAEMLVDKIMSGGATKTQAIEHFRANHGGLATIEYTPKFEVAERNFTHLKKAELEKKSLLGTWNRTTVYISGGGNSGKTRLATKMGELQADEFGVHSVPGGGGKTVTTDIVDGYENQKVAILDDLDTTVFSYRDFYRMFDPNNWAMTKSRSYNKPWFPEWVYITNDMDIGKYMFELLFYSRKDFRSRDGKLANMSDDDIKALGLARLNGRKGTLEACRMLARRVKYYLHFDYLDDGTPILQLMQLVDVLPTIQEIREYVDTWCEGIYNEKLFGLFFRKLAYAPYDATIIEKIPFDIERKRVGQIVLDFYEFGKPANGLVILKEKTLLSDVQNKIKKDDKRRELSQQKERQRILVLEEKAKKYDELKSVEYEQLKLQEQENDMLKMIIEKMSTDGNIANPFEASLILDNVKRQYHEIHSR